VKLIWAVRSISDASWAFPLFTNITAKDQTLYITSAGETGADSVEMVEPLGSSYKAAAEDAGINLNLAFKPGRPDLREVTEELFSSIPERIAFFVCGPSSMTNDLQHQVTRWVTVGSDYCDVFWHAEAFGF
jgi:hypothetical protein